MDDLISRQTALNTFEKWLSVKGYSEGEMNMLKGVIYKLRCMPSTESVIRCEDCKWYDTTEEMTYGYCEAIKHSYYSRKWEINIHRTYPPDFYCADAEPKDKEEDDSDET